MSGSTSIMNDVTMRDWQFRTREWLQGKTFEAAVQFARAEGKIPAPETGHAILEEDYWNAVAITQ